MFHYTVETDQTVEQAAKKLTENLKGEGFGVLWQFNIQDKLKEKNIALENSYEILEVCNPFEAEKILKTNKLASYFLPCKIVVYTDGDQTKIGFTKLTELMAPLEDEAILKIAKTIEQKMVACIDKTA